jgi:putative SOS response-associated peptidase YedK
MIVTEAHPFMSEIHDRMPLFLGQETLHPWLESKAGTEILLPTSAARLRAWPVSRRVNSSKADKEDRTLIEPIKPGAV